MLRGAKVDVFVDRGDDVHEDLGDVQGAFVYMKVRKDEGESGSSVFKANWECGVRGKKAVDAENAKLSTKKNKTRIEFYTNQPVWRCTVSETIEDPFSLLILRVFAVCRSREQNTRKSTFSSSSEAEQNTSESRRSNRDGNDDQEKEEDDDDDDERVKVQTQLVSYGVLRDFHKAIGECKLSLSRAREWGDTESEWRLKVAEMEKRRQQELEASGELIHPRSLTSSSSSGSVSASAASADDGDPFASIVDWDNSLFNSRGDDDDDDADDEIVVLMSDRMTLPITKTNDSSLRQQGTVTVRVRYRYPASWDRLYRGVQYAATGQYELALLFLTEAIDAGMYGGHGEAFSLRSKAYVALNRLDDAYIDSERLIFMHPMLAEGYYRKGLVLLAGNQYEMAEAMFRAGLLYNPYSKILLHSLKAARQRAEQVKVLDAMHLGHVALLGANYERAIEHLSELLDEKPKIAECYVDRAFCQFALRRWDNGIADIDKALMLQPFWPTRSTARAGYLHKKGDVNPAWKKRFCVVRHAFLFYFTSESATAPQGFVPLVHCTLIPGSSEHRTFQVQQIEGPRRLYTFRGVTLDDAREWERFLDAICRNPLEQAVAPTIDVDQFHSWQPPRTDHLQYEYVKSSSSGGGGRCGASEAARLAAASSKPQKSIVSASSSTSTLLSVGGGAGGGGAGGMPLGINRPQSAFGAVVAHSVDSDHAAAASSSASSLPPADHSEASALLLARASLPSDIRQWAREHVRDWLESSSPDIDASVRALLYEANVDGPALMRGLKPADLKQIGIAAYSQRKLLREAISFLIK
jgi:tetratricopeptide (TPR) repeat protein